MEKVRVIIVDDQQIIIDGLSALFNGHEQLELVGTANSGKACLLLLEQQEADVVIMDLNMPGQDGIESTEAIRETFPDIPVLMLTGYDDMALIRDAMRRGAQGYVLKNADRSELLHAILTVAQGHRYLDPQVQALILDDWLERPQRGVGSKSADHVPLTPREIDVLRQIVAGKTSAEAAKILYVSTSTVDTHRKNILSKCGVKNTADLVRYAIEHKLV